MLTAFVSTILGLVGGILPDVVKEVRDTRNATREREFLKLQATLALEAAKATADAKLREIDASLFVEEAKAFREHLTAILESQNKPSGVVWIDGVNAIIRPATAALMMLLFAWTAVVFINGVMDQLGAGKVDGQMAATLIWNSLIGEAILATLGFLFGYRSARKRAGA
jgi:hypothetical protein